MYFYRVNKLPKNTLEINLNIPTSDINEEYEKAFSRLQQELTVEGFRKGKVPKAMAEKHLSKETVYQEMIKVLLPRLYEEILKKESLKPIISPKIELIKAKEKEYWQIKITLAEKPLIELGDYKKIIKETKANQRKGDIWVPGKESASAKASADKENKNKLLNEVLNTILKTAKVELSPLIIEEELNHRLTRLLDDVQKIGLTVENYLKSKNLTMEQLKASYRKEIEDSYKLEFILSEVADKENIKVEKEDLDKLFSNIKEEKERKAAEENSYFYASILRKQKTLDFLISL